MWTQILAVIAGLVAGFVVVSLAMALSSLIYKPPKDLDFQDRSAMQLYMETLPLGAFLLVLLGHALGAFSGAFVCQLIVGTPWQIGPMIIGGFFLLGGLMNLRMVPHPTWFAALDLLSYLPAAWLGGYLARLI